MNAKSSIRKVFDLVITPQLAEEWIGLNDPTNRRKCQSAVDEYARDMACGKWGYSPDPIMFDTDGILMNGQHRLLAIIKSGVSVRMRVEIGVPPGDRRLLDQGRRRRLAHVFGWLGLSNLRGVYGEGTFAGAVRKMMTGWSAQKGHTTLEEEIEFATTHADALGFAFRVVSRRTRVVTSPVFAAIARAYYHVDHGKLEAFGAVLGSGLMTHPCDATVISLRESLARLALGNSNIQQAIYRKTSRAIQAYANGEIQRRSYEAPRELFPLPEGAGEPIGRAPGLPWVNRRSLQEREADDRLGHMAPQPTGQTVYEQALRG